ncbi:MAG: alpha/beta hydrolase [Acidobacteriota bacterium]
MRIGLTDVDTRLIDEGTGAPCLLLHGNPDSADLWAGLIARLKHRHRCLAIDLPGFGDSMVTGDFDCSLEAMAAFVDEVLEAAGVQTEVDLVMHDFGGPFGISWAIRHPHKVRRMVIMDSLYFADYRWHFWGRVWRTWGVGELSMVLMNRWIFAWEQRRGGPRLDPETMRRTYGQITPATKRMVLRLYRATDPENFASWEEEMLALTAKRPTCVLWGAEDPYIPARYAYRFGTDRVRVLPGVGHWLPLEATSQVASEVMRFLS